MLFWIVRLLSLNLIYMLCDWLTHSCHTMCHVHRRLFNLYYLVRLWLCLDLFCYFLLVIQLKKSTQKFGRSALTELYSSIKEVPLSRRFTPWFYVWLDMLYGCIINNNVSSMYYPMWAITVLHRFADVMCITITQLDISCSLQQLCRCCSRHQKLFCTFWSSFIHSYEIHVIELELW